MGRRLAWTTMLTLLLLPACAAGNPSPTGGPPPTPPPPHPCQARAGSVTDVASEPDWRQYADYTPWTTPDGCLLRIDVIADRPGPSHCDMQAARVIITGRPVGAPYSTEADTAQYVRDPQDVFGDPQTAAAFEPDADLPPDAVDTGYRQASSSLWVVRADPSSIYVVDGDTTERWPLDPEPAGCV
ncbi:MAG: hypothetical protein ABI622_07150 [Chloroflexota bacterium]